MPDIMTDLFIKALKRKGGYHFLARETDRALHAFQKEPTWNGTTWEGDGECPIALTEEKVEQLVREWNMEKKIPDSSKIRFDRIREMTCVRIREGRKR